jgi:GSH-dependent disulfide-bond oxidoreductase
MIRFYFHPTPNPAKVALFLEESGLTYELVPVDTSKGEQHQPSFRAANPNGKVPAIVDTEGPGGKEARVFDSSAILLYLAEKTGRFLGQPADGGELLSWLFFLGTGLGPFSGQAVHFQFAAPDGRDYIVGSDYPIVDMSAWCWIDRASRVMKAQTIPWRRSQASSGGSPRSIGAPRSRGRAVGKDPEFKKVNDEKTKRALFPSNYPATDS